MKKYIVIATVFFALGCFASSSEVAKNVIDKATSIAIIEEQIETLIKLQGEIKLLAQSYDREVSKQSEAYENVQVMQAGFGCTPKKPEKPKEEPKPEVVKPVEPVKPVPQVIPKVVKPAIIDVKGEQKLVGGRMMFTKMTVKLNKQGLDKVKKGAKVRIFIDYCYYESGKIEKDGTVSFDIGWHPPLTPVKGKIAVSLFMQTNTPEIGSGIQYCSTVITS